MELFSSQSCSEFNSQNCSEAMTKRQQQGDYNERVVARSKPVRNLVSRSCAGPSTTPSSTVFSSPETLGTKDHEMRFETRTEKPNSNNQQESIIKRDRMTNSQERYEEARSRGTTGPPMTRNPSQTEDLTGCTGHLVPTFLLGCWQWLGDGYRIHSARISFKEQVDERLRIFLNRPPGDKIEGIVKNSLIWRIFMTSSLHAAIFLGKGYSENLRSIRNTGQKPTVQKLFDATRTLIHEQELEIPGVSDLSWCSSKWEELHLARHAAHERKSLCILLLCIVRGKMSEYLQPNAEWENIFSCFKSTPQNKVLDGPDGNQWSWSGEYSQTQHAAHPPRNPKVDGTIGLYTRRISRKNCFYVDVLRHLFGKMKETNSLVWKINQR